MGKGQKGSGTIAYTIDFTRRSRRQFLKLPTQIQHRIQPHIDALGIEPRPSGYINSKDSLTAIESVLVHIASFTKFKMRSLLYL